MIKIEHTPLEQKIAEITKNKVILIVEDEYYNYMFLNYALKQHTTAELHWAKNGKEAIEECKCFEFDLILMDINLPEINGFMATKEIKSKNPNIPIIAQTAFTTIVYKKQMYKCGIDYIIDKPIRLNKLLDVLIKYL